MGYTRTNKVWIRVWRVLKFMRIENKDSAGISLINLDQYKNIIKSY